MRSANKLSLVYCLPTQSFFHQDQLYQENLLTKYYLKKGHEVTILASTTESIFDYYNGVYNKSNKPNSSHVLGKRLRSYLIPKLQFKYKYPTYKNGYIELIQEEKTSI